MATDPLRRPRVPGMSVREAPMTGAQAQQFGMSPASGGARPSIPGMNVRTAPMTGAQAQQFGLGAQAAPPPRVDTTAFDNEVRERASNLRAARPAASTAALPPQPTAVPAAAPPTVGPGQQSFAQRARGGLKGLGSSLAKLAGPAAAAVGGYSMGKDWAEQDAASNADYQANSARREHLVNQIPGAAMPYTESAPTPASEVAYRDVAENVNRIVSALPFAGSVARVGGLGANVLREVAGRGAAAAGSAGVATTAGAVAGYGMNEADDAGPRAAFTPPAYTPNPGNTSGRGVESPLRTDRDPTSAAFGRSRDYTPELGAVPAQLPSDLRQGVIHKTQGPNGTVYSGANVTGANPQMVDGMGATLRGRGSVNVMQGMSRDEIDRTLGRGAYAPAPQEARPPMPQGAAPGSLFDTPRARRAAEQLRQGRETIDTQRRGQDVTARGQDLVYTAQMADTAERREGRNAAAREKSAAAAEQRRRAAGYMQQANNNPLEAARAARMAGDTDVAKDFDSAAEGEDKIAVQRNEQYRKIFAPMATATDDDGKGRVDDALLEQYVGLADSAAQAVGKSVEELQANPAMFRGAVKLVEAMNKNREDSWLKRVGWDDTDPVSQVPSLRGARTEKVYNPASASGFGARRINLPNGGQVTLDAESYDDPELRDLLTTLGVK